MTHAWSMTFLRANRLSARHFAILNPGAGWPSKVWPAERYGQVAQHLARVHGMESVAVWGAPDELPMAETIVATSNGQAFWRRATSMTELGALCRRAALFVGSDTGPMHLAVAVGTPTISMHGTSRAEWCGAYGPENIRLQVRYQAGSALERRRADNSAMCAITVGDGLRRVRPADTINSLAAMWLIAVPRPIGRFVNSSRAASRHTAPVGRMWGTRPWKQRNRLIP